MGIIFTNGLSIGTIPNNSNGRSGEWYLATGPFGYQPGWTYGVTSWPMNIGSYGTNNPNEILTGNTAGIYINLYDSTGTANYNLISDLVGHTGTITFRQVANHITYGFTSNTFADGTNMFGSIFWSPGGGPFGTLGPLTLISTSNTTFTGYSDGDNNNNSGGPLTYTGSTIAPNNSELVTVSYTTDAPSGITLNVYVGGDNSQVCYGPPAVSAHTLTTNRGATSLCDATHLYGDSTFANYLTANDWNNNPVGDVSVLVVGQNTIRRAEVKNGGLTLQLFDSCYSC